MKKKDSKTRVKTIFRAFTGLRVTKLRERAERTTFQREEGSISPLSAPLGMAHAPPCNKEAEGRTTPPSKEKQDSRLPLLQRQRSRALQHRNESMAHAQNVAWLLAFGFWLLAFGFWLWPLALAFGFGVLALAFGFGLWLWPLALAFGFWLLAFGFWLLAFGFWLLAFGFWLLAFGFWLLAFGFWLLAFGPKGGLWALAVWAFGLLGFGLWALGFGLLAFNMALGVWALGFGRLGFGLCIRHPWLWALGFGLLALWRLAFNMALGVGRWALGVGRWALGVGRWALFALYHCELGVGRWALGVGCFGVGCCVVLRLCGVGVCGVCVYLLLSGTVKWRVWLAQHICQVITQVS